MNLKTILDEELQNLIQESRDNPRKRAIQTFHDDFYGGPQVCLNVIQPESYIRPHLRYSDESLIHYQGRLCSIQFDQTGNITQSRILQKNSPYVFLLANTFHTIISLQEDSAIWMIVQGPHNPKKFSEFLPETPNEKDNYHDYFEKLKSLA